MFQLFVGLLFFFWREVRGVRSREAYLCSYGFYVLVRDALKRAVFLLVVNEGLDFLLQMELVFGQDVWAPRDALREQQKKKKKKKASKVLMGGHRK